MADGVLTPAVSVTSAAAGIAVAKPSTADKITGISLVSDIHRSSLRSSTTIAIGFPHPPIPCATFRHIKARFHVCAQ